MGKFILYEEDGKRQPKAGEWYVAKDMGGRGIDTPYLAPEDWDGDDPEMTILIQHEFANMNQLLGFVAVKYGNNIREAAKLLTGGDSNG